MSDTLVLADVVVEVVTDEILTPYAVIKATNEVFVRLGVDKELPTQMGYQYAKKGMFGNEKGTKKITRDQAITWITKYITKTVTV